MFPTVRLAAVSACLPVLVAASCAWAASDKSADRLGRDLTTLGGEMAGNASGTIPRWQGIAGLPAPESGIHRPDPFPNEKPSVVITAKNAAQYADKLPDGAMQMFKLYPDTYRIDVYPTHRTAAAPQFVYDNTKANVTRARLADDGNALQGAFGGPPFPIPDDAKEVMWNMLLAWRGSAADAPGSAYVVTSDGSLVLSSRVEGHNIWPYYDPDGSPATFKGTYWYLQTTITEPSYQNGNATLLSYTTNPVADGSPAWQYLPGQRRIRKAPNFVYDMPIFFTSGVGQFDEGYGFLGAMDRYDWKLAGKKEMYVPYNSNRWWLASPEQQASSKHHENPDLVRWELHRVWVVEAILKSGSRNVVGRRRLFIDEDSWNPEMVDEWDTSGSYWHYIQMTPVLLVDLPAQLSISFQLHDFKAGNWALVNDVTSVVRTHWKSIPYDLAAFTPENLAASGVR